MRRTKRAKGDDDRLDRRPARRGRARASRGPLGELIERLTATAGCRRGARRRPGDRAGGAGRRRRSGASPTTRAASRPARCSSRSTASTSTATTSSRRPRPRRRGRDRRAAASPRARCRSSSSTRRRAALADAAAWWYGDPSRELGVVGITGTDGKTTTSFLAVAALEAAGLSTGLVGTVETKIGGGREANPEHLDDAGRAGPPAGAAGDGRGRQRRPRSSRRRRTASPPIASAAIAYDVAILTNLTHEHLEFHGSWEAYRDAKLSLFERLAVSGDPAKAPPAPAWPKAGDRQRRRPVGRRVRRRRPGGRRADRHVRHRRRAPTSAPTRVEEDGRRLRVAYEAPSRRGATLELRLAGRFNVHNALAVVALGEGLGLDPAAVRAGLESVERRARAGWSAIDAGPAVRRRHRLRPQPGLARGGPRHARAGRGGARRRADRGLRVGRGAGHRRSGR